ncbi:MAG: HDOD domain-containing protein [Calditrichia bacterium]
MEQAKIYRRIQSISKLSTLPVIAAKVVSMVENPKTTASELGKVISTDQALTSRILRLANSAYYGFPRKISTLTLAIVVLGFSTLKDLVLSISILGNFKTDKEHELFDPALFWEHGFTVAIASKIIAEDMRMSAKGEAFVAGLLHDIGSLVLFEYFHDEFNKIVETAKTEKLNILEAEKKVLGINHATIGGWLAESWHLPETLYQTIAYHHNPLNVRKKAQQNLAAVVYLADLMAAMVDKNLPMEKYKDLTEEKINIVKQKLFPENNRNVSFYLEKLNRELENAHDFFELFAEHSKESI